MPTFRILAAMFFFLPFTFKPLQAQWIQSADLGAGEVHCFAVNESDIFAGTFGGGVFHSTDNGASWNAVNNGMTNTFIRSLCVSPDGSGGTNLFAGTSGGGIFRSTDNGTLWTAVNNGFNYGYVQSFAVKDSFVFAGSQGHGVFRSSNNGANWSAVSNGLTNGNVRSLIVKGTDIFAGAYGGGVFRSTGNGVDWTEANIGLTNYFEKDLAVIGTDLFVGTNGGGVFHSSDNGGGWTAVNTSLTNLYVRTLAVSGTNLFAGTYGGGIFLSTNNGVSWNEVNTGLSNSVIYSLAVKGSYVFAGTQSGDVWKRPLSEMVVAHIAHMTVGPGWNLLSVPILHDSLLAGATFPRSEAIFSYDTSIPRYTIPSLVWSGSGYWAFYMQADTLSITGTSVETITTNVTSEGWVIVGSRTLTAPVSSLISIPSGLIQGEVFRFDNTLQQYQIADEITPGEGYWVYVSGPCQLKLQ